MAQSTPLPYLDPSLEIELRITDLLERLTLEEKAGQMTQFSSSQVLTGPAQNQNDSLMRDLIRTGQVGALLNMVSAGQTRAAQELVMQHARVPIPLLFGFDVIHGHQTMFPIPLAMSCSWEPAVMERAARIAAREASAAGLHWTFAPMLDISRDPRWGRVMEGAGEDAFLASVMAEAQIRGFQGDDLSDPTTIAACAKHFAGYGFAEAGRDYNTVDVSDYTLHNDILAPFQAAAEAGVATFMNAFNEIGGMPATAHTYLQRELLKGKWGFDGFVVSDWNSIGELIDHGLAPDKRHAAELAVNAGNDMDMMARAYLEHLPDLVREGLVSESVVDEAVRRILRLKFRLGLFDDPYRYCDPEREQQELGSAENLAAAREIGRRSIVLLKNDNALLPLSPALRSVALIGQLAADKDSPQGSWRAAAIQHGAVSVLEGLREALPPQTRLEYARGVLLNEDPGNFHVYPEFNATDTAGLGEAVALAQRSELVIAVIGENCFQSGEAKSRTDLSLPGLQQEMLEALYQANPNLIVVLMNGRPLDLTWMDANIPAILETWHAGTQSGHAIADVLTGKYNPSGKLTMSFPRAVGQIPVFYNHKNAGRPYDPQNPQFQANYRDLPNEPLYPFGYGLSYTTFEYTNLSLNTPTLRPEADLEVSVTVTNTGKVAGEEIVQLYIRDLVASRTRPVKELKGFQKIFLEPGQSQTLTFSLQEADLAFYSARNRLEAEPGAFEVMVGPNSMELLKANFVLERIKD